MIVKKNRQKKLLIITPSLVGGGAEKVAVNLANEWCAQGYEVHLTSMLDITDYSDLLLKDVCYWCLNTKRVRYSVPALRRHLRYIKPDLVLSAYRDSNIILGLSSIKMNQMRVVFREATTLNGLDGKPMRRLFFLTSMRLLYAHADAVIANSLDTLSDLQRHKIKSKKMEVIPNPVIPKAYKSLMEAPTDHRWFTDESYQVVLSVGRFHPAKDHSTLLRAFSYLIQRKPSARLVLIGQGSEENKLKALRSALDLEDTVTFLGFKSNPWPFYNHSDLFVLSSRWEGFGNVLVEALATGTTIVTTDCPGGPRGITKNGEYGYLVPVNDPVKMSEAMYKGLEEPHKPNDLRRRGQEFSVQDIARRYLAMFDKHHQQNLG